MFVGHAALALLAKRARPRVSLAVLLPAAYAPDLLEVALTLARHRNYQLSHSLPSVGVGATVLAVACWLARRDAADAAIVWLAYVSHWPADFITGLKPTWPGEPYVGLMLYDRPFWDWLLESALIAIAWVVYRRMIPPERRRRWVDLSVPIALAGLQALFATSDLGLLKLR